ncbi:hypothetical protein POPTR_016G128300v4 [Populus trichocarpa]|uniref:WRKY domain-containing protein n=3 Tax=Populus TaxID=3689 RepID=B9IGK6_POPTR|nr:probable WRKY transcription factor 33 [Populus trichocarpa]KAI5561425.1 hypothetical protein BDE02_16G115300 [Populus trichocarpa]PNS99329.1 hypothetical protein POPTR_016G128300v4 [Populus trichocarpa]|eukprot:XP_002323637.2 probable WRKY transcription factor 33 [Populus trichocarpa]
MASSASASISNSMNSPSNFSFSTQFMTSSSSPSSFTNLLSSNNKDMDNLSWGLYDHGTNDRIGIEIPNYKSFQPFSPPPVSPSSYFAIPPGLSPTELLDSPVLFPTSNGLASPTTGAFAGQTFNWRGNSNDNQQGVSGEEKNYSDFSFPTQTRPPAISSSFFQSSSNSVTVEKSLKRKQEEWNFDQLKQTDFSSDQKTGVKSEFAPEQSFSSELVPLQANMQSVNTAAQPSFNQYNQSAHYMRENKRSDDGYNWRKYGQKQVKGSENPRSYYKCTYPNCPTKKKVERSLDGQITEIVYKGSHNHPKLQSSRRSSSQLVQPSGGASSEISDQSIAPIESSMMQEDSSISLGEDEFDQSSSMNSGEEDNANEPDAKRWQGQNENESILGAGSRTVREPRIVVQTTSDIDILDDGYRWRKYGQKVVKGNPNPRSYYKCTSVGCPVRKHVERASQDLRAVITTYEGKHNHDVPAARGSGYMNKAPSIANSTANAPIPIRPSVMANHSNQTSYPNSLHSTRSLPASGSQAPFTLEMLQGQGSFEYSSFGKQNGTYMNQTQYSEGVFPRAKEEPKNDSFFDPFLN